MRQVETVVFVQVMQLTGTVKIAETRTAAVPAIAETHLIAVLVLIIPGVGPVVQVAVQVAARVVVSNLKRPVL